MLQVNVFGYNAAASGNVATPGEISLEWLGETPTQNQITATGNVFSPAKIMSVPPKESLAGSWTGSTTGGGQFSAADVLFVATIGPQDVVEVIVEWAPSTQSGFSYTTSGLTTGTFYYGHLDGIGGDLIPVGNVPVY